MIFMPRPIVVLLLAALMGSVGLSAQHTPVYFAPEPGVAQAEVNSDGFSLSNNVLRVSWTVANRHIQGAEFETLIDHRGLPAQAVPFTLLLRDGTLESGSTMKMVSAPKVITLDAHPDAARLSERIPGKAVVVELEDDGGKLDLTWKIILRNGSNYVRQEIALLSNVTDVPVREVRLVDWQLPDAHVVGTVKGSPIVATTLFAGFEDPLSSCAVANERARCWIERELPLKAGQTVTYSSVAGVLGALPFCH